MTPEEVLAEIEQGGAACCTANCYPRKRVLEALHRMWTHFRWEISVLKATQVPIPTEQEPAGGFCPHKPDTVCYVCGQPDRWPYEMKALREQVKQLCDLNDEIRAEWNECMDQARKQGREEAQSEAGRCST